MKHRVCMVGRPAGWARVATEEYTKRINGFVPCELVVIREGKSMEVDMSEKGKYLDANFNTIYESFITVFIVLTGDSWTDIYYRHYIGVNKISSTIFFISLIIIGQYILLMLFVAILVDNFYDG